MTTLTPLGKPLVRYRETASDLRGKGMFDEFVKFLLLSILLAPAAKEQAAIDEAMGWIRAILQVDAEDCGLTPEEARIPDVTGAVLAETRALLATMPAVAGHA